MAAKKPTGPERVHSKSFNGPARGTVLRRVQTPVQHSYFGSEFALVEFDHHPEPIWSSQQWLKKPAKADLYERWRADPRAAVTSLVAKSTEEVLRTCARISGGQLTHHDGASRWTGLVRALPLDEGTDVLVTLIERLASDPGAEGFDEPAVLDGSEYNKSDFKYGPRVRYIDVLARLTSGLEGYWSVALGDQPTTLETALSPALLARARAVVTRNDPERASLFTERFTRRPIERVFGGTSRDHNERCGLDNEFAMVGGTGY